MDSGSKRRESGWMIRSIFTGYLSFTVNILVTILLTPFLIYYLGRSGYGLWVTLGSLLGYVSLLDLGLYTTSTKFVAECRGRSDPNGLNTFIATAFVTYLIMGFVALGSSIFLSFYLAELFPVSSDLATVGKPFLLVAGTSLALSFPLSLLNGILFGFQRLDVLNLINTLGSVCNGFFSVMALKIGSGMVGVAWVGLATNVLTAALKWSFIRREFPHVRIQPGLFDAAVLKKTLSYAFYVFLVSVGAQVVFNTDNIIIGKFLGIAAVTSYAVAFRLSFILMQGVFKVVDVLPPTFSELYSLRDTAKLRALFVQSSKFSVGLAVPITIVLVLFGEDIIRLWVGRENFVGMPTLLGLAALTFMHSFVHPGAVMLLTNAGRVRAVCFFNIAEAVLNLVLSIALVRRMGVLGVILGTVFAQALTNLWYLPISAVREVGLSLSGYMESVLLRPVLAGLPAVGVGVLMSHLFSDADGMMIAVFSLIVFAVYVLGFLSVCISRQERSVFREKAWSLVRWIRGVSSIARK